MELLNWCAYCILYMNIQIVLAGPLGKTATPKPSNPKYALSLFKNKANNFGPQPREKLAVKPYQYSTEDYEDDSSELGSGDLRPLEAMTKKILGRKEFAPNDTNYDYSAIDFPVPQKLAVPNPRAETTEALRGISLLEMHERAKYMRVSEIKQALLDKLRLFAPPNVTALKLKNMIRTYPDHILPKIPDETSDIQGDEGSPREDNFHAKISKTIQFTTDFPAEKEPEKFPTESIAYFSLPLTVSQKNVKKATLLVYIATPDYHEGKKIKLTISDSRYRNKPFINRTVILTSRGHWEHVDVSRVLRSWAGDEANNYGLYIRAMVGSKNLAYLHDDPLAAAKETIQIAKDISTRPQRMPLVKILLNKQPGRYRRSFDEPTLTCDINDEETRCCRYRFVIDFATLGPDYEFIIQPRRFLANYCAGTCPTYYVPTDNNARLMMGLPKPKYQRCCAPASKKDLNIVYIADNGGVMLGKITDMTIERCHCL